MRFTRKTLFFPGIVPLLVFAYLLGPRPKTPVYSAVLPEVPTGLSQLDNFVNTAEAALPVKPDNEARIVWADISTKKQTEYAVVYLHGFQASQGDGDPVHRNFAKTFGCNLYLSRLSGNGLKGSNAMLSFTPEHVWASALRAYAIGRKIGKKVILIGTSTGGLLALRLAATFPEIKGLILYSPNIEINSNSAWIMNNPWGLQIVKMVFGGNYKKGNDKDPKVLQYWYNDYRVESLPQLQEFMENTNKAELYSQVKQPVLMLYYYKDKDHQDSISRVDAMLDMFSKLGTPAALKEKKALPNTGIHVISSSLLSKDVNAVEVETQHFARTTLGMIPVPAAH
jgi:esterase/lipase